VIVSDLAVYHAGDVRAGIENDDLFERLGERLAEARVYFEERVAPELARRGLFDRAVVDVLVYNSRNVPSRIW
jgi:hypothetical protein